MGLAFQLGLALPSWLVEKGNAGLVLLVYTLAFGVFLPLLVVIYDQSLFVIDSRLVGGQMPK